MQTKKQMKYLNDVNYKDCVGKVFKSKLSGDFKVLKYNDSRNVEIQFLKTGYEMVAQLGHIKNGVVKDPYLPSVYGVGILGTKYSTSINNKSIKEYSLWCDMLKRCYCENYHFKKPTYIGCEVSDNFKSYEYFYEWCHKQIGFNNKDWQLDKDLLIKGNKVYSENTCIFIHRELNQTLTKANLIRGEHPVGVCFDKSRNKFIACVCLNSSKRKYLGAFDTELDAFKAYKIAKENHIKEQANKWKSQIDERAYEALMNYQVEITD